ncbi:MAG: hypothetical protein ACP5JU_01115 [Minisyncoccia bacterium]
MENLEKFKKEKKEEEIDSIRIMEEYGIESASWFGRLNLPGIKFYYVGPDKEYYGHNGRLVVYAVHVKFGDEDVVGWFESSGWEDKEVSKRVWETLKKIPNAKEIIKKQIKEVERKEREEMIKKEIEEAEKKKEKKKNS